MFSKKSIKIVSIVALVAVMLMVFGSSAFAAVTIPGAKQDLDTSSVNPIVSTVFGVIQWGGIIAAVVIAMFIGIKFITSSPEGKAEVKKTLMFYVAGIVLLLAASGIVTVVANSIKEGTVVESTANAITQIITRG